MSATILLVYNTVVPRNVRVSEAPSFGQPVLIYDLKCRIAGLCSACGKCFGRKRKRLIDKGYSIGTDKG